MAPRALGEALAGLARANWELAVRTILDGVIRRSEAVGLASADFLFFGKIFHDKNARGPYVMRNLRGYLGSLVIR